MKSIYIYKYIYIYIYGSEKNNKHFKVLSLHVGLNSFSSVMSWIVIARQCTTIWHTKARGRVIKSTVKCFQPFNTDAFLPQYPEQVVLAVPPDQHTPTFSVHTITKAIHKQRPNKTCISSSNLPKSTRPTVP